MNLKSENALRGMLGIAQRAGKLQTGTDTVMNAIRSGKACLALVDIGASENAMKRMTDACAFRKVPLVRLPEGLLESACGRDGRVTGVLSDSGFAAKILSLMQETE